MFKQFEPADQESFRAEVEAAIDTLDKDERNNKYVIAVAGVVGIRIPETAAGGARQESSPTQ